MNTLVIETSLSEQQRFTQQLHVRILFLLDYFKCDFDSVLQ
jgi:hypothetical protein